MLLFLGRLEAEELLPLYALLLRPLLGPLLPRGLGPPLAGDAAPAPALEWDADAAALATLLERGGGAPGALLQSLQGVYLLESTPPTMLLGFLHLALQLLEALSASQLLPFLPALLAIALDLLKALHNRKSPAQREPAKQQWAPEGAERRPPLEELGSAEAGAEEACLLQGRESGKATLVDVSPPAGAAPALGRDATDPAAARPPGSGGASCSSPGRAKELRVLSLRLFGALLEKFPDVELGPEVWSEFFSALEGPLQQLGTTAASSANPGALFQCLQAVAERRRPEPLLRLAQHPGFLPSVLSLLGAPKAVAPPVLAATLGLLESICTFDERMGDPGGGHQDQSLDQEHSLEQQQKLERGGLGRGAGAASQPVLEQVVLPHLPQVLQALRELTTAAATPAAHGKRTR